jgi:putative DNA primase/helicase
MSETFNQHEDDLNELPPFRILGHKDSKFYFLARTGQIVEFTADKLNSIGSLMLLAPVRFWQENYLGAKGSISTRDAANDLIENCIERGIYNQNNIRGRGAWIAENGSVVYHLGDKIICNNIEFKPNQFRDKYVYENSLPIPVELSEKEASREEAESLLQLCKMFSWKEDHMPMLLAGILTVSPVCGALPWRTHAWITGSSGTGKTWIFDNLVKKILGGSAVYCQGGTTEPGIRQHLKYDALPVIFDESETQTNPDRSRMQQVLNLARQSSSDDGADVLKGTQNQSGTAFKTKSSYIFSSIQVSLKQTADMNRWVILTLEKDEDTNRRETQFKEMKAFYAKHIENDFGAKLLARTLRLLPVIRNNIHTFASAITMAGGTSRMGYTLGVPLSGLLSLSSESEISLEEASAMIDKFDWIKEMMKANEIDEDWKQALDFLVQKTIKYNTGNSLNDEIPVGELIGLALEKDGIKATNEQKTALLRAGIKIDKERKKASIAVNSEHIDAIFRGTQWEGAWLSTLSRMPSAYKTKDKVRFGSLYHIRALELDMEKAFPEI